MSNHWRTVYYTGVTNNLFRRFMEHITGEGSNFCKKYQINELVYYEEFNDINMAISREKKIKKLSKKNKLVLIKKFNPENKNLMGGGHFQ
jgi:putative endonuclease